MLEKAFQKGVVISGAGVISGTAKHGTGGECSNDIGGLSVTYTEKKFFGKNETKSGDALFLPWAGNGINYTESAGKDVISGPFTGCLMAIYTRSGARRVCHVATPECNSAWERVKGDVSVKVIKEFKPSASLTDKIVKDTSGGGMVIMGIATAEDTCYALFCMRPKDGDSLTVTGIVKL